MVSVVVAGAGDIGEIVERDGIAVIVIVQHIIIIEFHIGLDGVDIKIILQNQIILIEDGLFGDLFIGFDSHEAATRLAGVDLDNFPGVGANDGLAVQIVEPFAGAGTNTFDAPFLFGHETPLKEVFGIAGCGPLP
jgi:hypothetical protein